MADNRDGDVWADFTSACQAVALQILNLNVISQLAVAIKGLLVPYAILPGETGVVNPFWPVGNPYRYGASGDGVTNDSTAVNNCRLSCIATGYPMQPTTGTYLITAGAFSWFSEGFTMVGIGPSVVFSYTGAGVAFDIGNGGIGNYAKFMRFENFIVVGNAATTYAIRAQGMVRGEMTNVRFRNATTAGVLQQHCVSSEFNNVRYEDGESTTRPPIVWQLDEDGAGRYTANCNYRNCTIEGGADVGWKLVSAQGNNFYGGSPEGPLATGVQIASGGIGNNFFGVWMEANTAKDVEDAGSDNRFYGCRLASNTAADRNLVVTTGNGSKWFGGYVRARDLQSGSSDTVFTGVSFDENALFIGSGSYQYVGCKYVDSSFVVVGRVPDAVVPFVTLTDAATIAVDASLGTTFVVTLTDNRTMGAPTNPQTGTTISFIVIQDGTGGRTLAWNAAYNVSWSDTGNLLNRRSTVQFVYDGSVWQQIGAQRLYA